MLLLHQFGKKNAINEKMEQKGTVWVCANGARLPGLAPLEIPRLPLTLRLYESRRDKVTSDFHKCGVCESQARTRVSKES